MGLKDQPRAGAAICPATGKTRMTKGDAKSLAKRGRGETVNLQAYKCDRCRGWHVGNRRRVS